MENNGTLEATEVKPPVAATTETTATVATIAEKEAELSDEQFLALHNKKFGTEYKSLDELKPKAPEPTDAEKQMALSTSQKKALDKFVELAQKKAEKSGKFISIDDATKDYYAKKSIANGDVAEMSRIKVEHQLIAAGLTKEEAQIEMKARYHQYTDEDLSATEDDAERNSLLKKREIFTKRLNEAALPDKMEAARELQEIQNRIDDEAYEASVDARLTKEAEDYAKTFNRKKIVELGEFKGTPLSPVEHTISEEKLSEIVNIVKDKKQREALLFNEDGSEKVDLLIKYLALEATVEDLVKKASTQTSNENLAYFERFTTTEKNSLITGGERNVPSNGQFTTVSAGQN